MVSKGARSGSVRFEFVPGNGEKRVLLAGSFNQWRARPMQKRNGKFIAIEDLPPGEYEYKLIVDGQWKVDPDNALSVPNQFGDLNSLLVVHG